ncbi:alcohol oxidase [Agrocybe pediades]|nr:alcohol oxidase [Agrocybe pediades]
MFSPTLLSFVLASLITPSLTATLNQPSQIKALTYDYIIVGGGTAGLVLANRLTEDPTVTVLVLEAGVSDQGLTNLQVPFLGPTLTPNTIVDWNYTVTPQPGMNGRSFAYPRGRVLGGSSSVNYLFHQFGTDEDWNRLASVSGDIGWNWTNMKKYVQKHEKFVPPIDGHNTAGQFIPSLHGFNGEVSVSLPGNNQTIDPRVLATTKQLAEFPFNQDTSGGDHSLLGIGFLQSSAGGGVRSSSSTSYLANASNRPGLTVVVNAPVTKLLSTGNGKAKGTVAFRSVEFRASPATPAGTSTARKEVILSAGTVGSAQILQLSGIGDPARLKSANVNSLVANSDVGENLSDHTLLPNLFSVQGNLSFDGVLRSADLSQAAFEQWAQNKTGMFANNIVNNYGFARLPSNSPLLKPTDPAAGPKSPHFEMITSNVYFNPGIPMPPTGSFMTIVTVLSCPTSRGSIRIKSNNPTDAPLINPNYLSTAFDIGTMIESVKAIKRFIAAPAWKDYVIGPFGDAFAAATSDASIESYVRGLTTTIFHPVGTASMSSKAAKNGVVNPDLTVKGTEGLRVVDASVFPFVPSTHTQGPVYLVAERAADIIKQANQ